MGLDILWWFVWGGVCRNNTFSTGVVNEHCIDLSVKRRNGEDVDN